VRCHPTSRSAASTCIERRPDHDDLSFCSAQAGRWSIAVDENPLDEVTIEEIYQEATGWLASPRIASR
jgi:hypothetical protein